MMKRPTEPSDKERIRSILKRQREQIRQARLDEEFETVYKDNLCPICHQRHMTGVVCRQWRGNVCMKHCFECEHYEHIFGHCLYHETEPLDARRWKLIFTCSGECLLLLEGQGRQTPIAALEPIVQNRLSLSFIVYDHQDKVGDHIIVDTKTGEITPYVLKFLKDADAWVCVEYLPPGK